MTELKVVKNETCESQCECENCQCEEDMDFLVPSFEEFMEMIMGGMGGDHMDPIEHDEEKRANHRFKIGDIIVFEDDFAAIDKANNVPDYFELREDMLEFQGKTALVEELALDNSVGIMDKYDTIFFDKFIKEVIKNIDVKTMTEEELEELHVWRLPVNLDNEKMYIAAEKGNMMNVLSVGNMFGDSKIIMSADKPALADFILNVAKTGDEYELITIEDFRILMGNMKSRFLSVEKFRDIADEKK